VEAYIKLQSAGHSGALLALKQAIDQIEEDWPKQKCSGDKTKLQQLLSAPLCKHIRNEKLEPLAAIASSPRTDALVDAMQVKLVGHPNPRIIIFVEQRETAHLLADFLNSSPLLQGQCRSALHCG
jgi:ERCC4-related helicase